MKWQLDLYEKEFSANFTSYQLHWEAATRPKPSRVSQMRMDKMVSLIMLNRLQDGERSKTTLMGDLPHQPLRYWRHG